MSSRKSLFVMIPKRGASTGNQTVSRESLSGSVKTCPIYIVNVGGTSSDSQNVPPKTLVLLCAPRDVDFDRFS